MISLADFNTVSINQSISQTIL